MNRRIIQDVVFPSKRPRDAQQKSVEEKTRSFNSDGDEFKNTQKEENVYLPRIDKNTGGGLSTHRDRDQNMPRKISPYKKVTWFVVSIVLIIAGGAVFSKYYSGATVKITPLNEIKSLSTSIVSRENSTEKEILPFKKIILPIEERSEVVSDTVEKEIAQKASGNIRIYNEYSSANQRLIINTRFESNAGKVYMIDNSIIVPGLTIVNGKKVPGSIVVPVYASSPGEEYNSAPTDFTVPGFKGDPRYSKFYARSETPLAGGFVGTVKLPTTDGEKKAKDMLKQGLEKDLRQKALAQVPNGYILFPETSFVVYDELYGKSEENFTPRVSVAGAFYGFIFEIKVLSRFVAERVISSYDEGDVTIRNMNELTLKLDSEVTDPEGINELSFTLSGMPHLVWDVDMNSLKQELKGVDKREGFQKVVGSHSAIKKAEARILPFWKKIFPDDTDEITIVEILK